MDYEAALIQMSPMLQGLLGQLRGQQSAQSARAGQLEQQMFADSSDSRTAQLQQLGGEVPSGYEGEVMPGMQYGADQERAASMPLIMRALMGERVR